MYFALIQSVLQYALLAWGGTFKTYSEVVIKAQKLVLKVALNRPWRYPSSLLYQEFCVPTLASLYAKELLILAFKHMHTNTIHEQPFTTRSRQRHDIYPTRVHKSIFKHSPQYLSIKLYNSIPAHLKQFQHAHQFKLYKKQIITWLDTLSNDQLDILLYEQIV